MLLDINQEVIRDNLSLSQGYKRTLATAKPENMSHKSNNEISQ